MPWRQWLLLVAAVAVAGPVLADPGAEEYYAGAHLKRVPIHVYDRLQKADAEGRAAYYVAVRDEKGRLVRVTKRLNGRVFFEHEYVYDAGGALVEFHTTNGIGVKKTFHRDKDGTYR